MRSFMCRLVLLLARMSPDEMVQALLRKIEFLQAEKEMLRSRLATPFRATLAERVRLIKLGKAIGLAGVKELITVVTPRTFARWLAGEKESRPSVSGPPPQALQPARVGVEVRAGKYLGLQPHPG